MAKTAPVTMKLATTSSIHDSGLLEPLCRAFEAQCGIQVVSQAVGSGRALRLGRRGEVDAVMAHHVGSELQFMEAGHGVNRREFMTNDFVLVGPPADPVRAARSATVVDALAALFRYGAPFISRGDDSGTNLRELDLWAAAGVLPFGQPWYRAAMGGMIHCLEVASESGAYALADSATFFSQSHRLALRVHCAGSVHLRNAYTVMAVNPARHPEIAYQQAMALIAFVTGAEGQTLIRNFRSPLDKKGDHPLFYAIWEPVFANALENSMAEKPAGKKPAEAAPGRSVLGR